MFNDICCESSHIQLSFHNPTPRFRPRHGLGLKICRHEPGGHREDATALGAMFHAKNLCGLVPISYAFVLYIYNSLNTMLDRGTIFDCRYTMANAKNCIH